MRSDIDISGAQLRTKENIQESNEANQDRVSEVRRKSFYLLCESMRNQNPFKPQDTDNLTQHMFSMTQTEELAGIRDKTIESMDSMSDNINKLREEFAAHLGKSSGSFESMSKSMSEIQRSSYANLLGSQVSNQTDEVAVNNGRASFYFDVPPNSLIDSLYLVLRDPNTFERRYLKRLEDFKSGKNAMELQIDGIEDGDYKISVLASNNRGESSSLNVHTADIVSDIEYDESDAGNTSLVLDSGKKILANLTKLLSMRQK